ncbi:MAG: hypothetical protein LBP42_00710 [Treponema sp.]|nr:hypothetical protein [Treponema sp.]
MFNIADKKENLTRSLSEQYSQNIINIDEYERLLEYIHKVETEKEIYVIEKIIEENNSENNKLVENKNNKTVLSKENDNHLSIFSSQTLKVKSIDGNGGRYMSVFGADKIIVDHLPEGRTIIDVSSIFALTEIIVPKDIKVTNKTVPIFSGIFTSNEINSDDEQGRPELYIKGRAVFGNITIKTIG